MKKLLFLVLLITPVARAQIQVPIASGVATIDAALSTNAQTSSFLIILNANVTDLEIIHPKTGQQITIIFQQDSTGGRTVVYASYIKNGATPTTTASAVTAQAFIYNNNTNTWSGLSANGGSSMGTVTSVAQTVPTWLAVAGSPITTSGTLAVTPASAQTSHQVIGTCNAATTFAPCALVAGDLPAGTTSTIASGTFTLGTGAISSATCATVVTVSATGVATTDVVTASFNGDPTGITGYAPSASGTLYMYVYPTTNNVNVKVCNNTSGSITPGAATLNFRVVR
jgi:hypothetical protein